MLTYYYSTFSHALKLRNEQETDDKIKMDTMELRSAPEDSNRKRQVRGRGRNTVGKNRGSKVIDRTTSSGCSTPNGQVEKVLNKVPN